jgi:parallel beta-helix repeat protein
MSVSALVVVALGLTANAFAKELRVGTCVKDGYTTIQAAVTAANAGDKVKVCPGTYTEQVTIGAGKDGLSLESEKPLQAIIKAPAVMTPSKTVVYVNGAQNVGVRGFTITGPGGGSCDSIEYGVLVDNGSATVEKNHITSIRDVDPASVDTGTGHSGCQNGAGVRFGSQFAGTTGTGSIRDNVIDDYQKGGIVVDNTGSDATIEHNTVTGWGPSAANAQNGIQVSRGATASIKNNAVSGNVYTVGDYEAIGIYLYNPGDVSTENNKVSANDAGIVMYRDDSSSSTLSVRNNDVSGSTYDGIEVDTTASVENNKVHENGEGIGLYYGVTGASIKNNEAKNNASNGFFADFDTSGNTFQNNKASGSGSFDCSDASTGGGTAGTANFWLNDKGATDSPDGICKP